MPPFALKILQVVEYNQNQEKKRLETFLMLVAKDSPKSHAYRYQNGRQPCHQLDKRS